MRPGPFSFVAGLTDVIALSPDGAIHGISLTALGNAPMNHRHRKVLHSLFAHPISANISLRDVESVFKELGADLSHSHSSKLAVHLGEHKVNFSTAHHKLPKEEVIQVRKFLETCEVDPEKDYPL
jgi:hypothetical protein